MGCERKHGTEGESPEAGFDARVKSQETVFCVIPAKANVRWRTNVVRWPESSF
jgi:hypothetical protein